jgi:hypothetical protein
VAPLQQSASWANLRRQLQEQNLQQRPLIEANELSILSSLGLLQQPQFNNVQTPLLPHHETFSQQQQQQQGGGLNDTTMSMSIPPQHQPGNNSDIHGLLGLSSSSSTSSSGGIDSASLQQQYSSSFAPVLSTSKIDHQQQQLQQIAYQQTLKQQQFFVHSLLTQERRIAEQDNLLNAAVSMLSSQLEGLRSVILSSSSSTPLGAGNSARSSAHGDPHSSHHPLDSNSEGSSTWGPAAEAQRLRSIIARMPPRDRVGAQTLFEISALDGEDGSPPAKPPAAAPKAGNRRRSTSAGTRNGVKAKALRKR